MSSAFPVSPAVNKDYNNYDFQLGKTGGPGDRAPLEEVVELMAAIQSGVKAGALDHLLAGQIFRLYHQLKLQGAALEQVTTTTSLRTRIWEYWEADESEPPPPPDNRLSKPMEEGA